MQTLLLLKLVQKNLLTVGTKIGVEVDIYEDQEIVMTIKAPCQITKISSNPLLFAPVIEVDHPDIISVAVDEIKMINGMTPNKYAAQFTISPMGQEGPVPKKRGRRPKVRNPEIEWSMEEAEEDEEDEELEAV